MNKNAMELEGVDDKVDRLTQLPTLVLVKIMQELIPEQVLAFGSVNKRINKLSKHSFIWERQFQQVYPRIYRELQFNNNEANNPPEKQDIFWYDVYKNSNIQFNSNPTDLNSENTNIELNFSADENKEIAILFHLMNKKDSFGFKKFVEKIGINKALNHLISDGYENIPLISLFKNGLDHICHFIFQEVDKSLEKILWSLEDELLIAITMNFPINRIQQIINRCDLDFLLCREKILGNFLQSPMHTAVWMNRIDVVEKLLERERFLTKNKKSVSLLCNLAWSGNLTPLHIAADFNYFKMASLLIKNGAEIDPVITLENHKQKGFTPLHIAILNTAVEVFHVLLNSKADIDNFMIGEESTPLLCLALCSGNSSILKELFEPTMELYHPEMSGFQKSMPPCLLKIQKEFMTDLLVFTISHSNIIYLDSIRFLLEKGADISVSIQQEEQQMSILAAILQKNKGEEWPVIEYLLMKGAKFTNGDDIPVSAVFRAISKNQIGLLKELVAFDKNLVNRTFFEKKLTPLMWAILSNQNDIALWLLEQGADVNERDTDGKNILSLMLERLSSCTQIQERKQLIATLLSKGANPFQPDHGGNTSNMIAVKSGYHDLAALFNKISETSLATLESSSGHLYSQTRLTLFSKTNDSNAGLLNSSKDDLETKPKFIN